MWSQRLLSVAYLTTGILHFCAPNNVRVDPARLPARASRARAHQGVAEIAGGLGLAVAGPRRAAGVWLIALLVLVFPANLTWRSLGPLDSIAPSTAVGRMPLQAC